MNIGLFISRANGAISQVIDLNDLAKEYRNLSVVKIYDNFFKASRDLIYQTRLNQLEGVVLAGDSKMFYQTNRSGSYLIRLFENAGINLNKIGFVNLKEQVAFPHRKERKSAYKKAKALINVALEKVKLSPLIEVLSVAPRRQIAILGTTVSGLLAAQRLLEKGYKVFLIDRGEKIRDLKEAKEKVLPTLSYIDGHKKVEYRLGVKVTDVSGYAGDYTIVLEKEGKQEELLVGGIILALDTDEDASWFEELHQFMHLQMSDDGFFSPLDAETLPVQTIDEGICLVFQGGSQSLRELALRADSAALSLGNLLDHNEIIHEVTISRVDEKVCGGCGVCVKTCMFKASSIDLVEKHSHIDPRRCIGCGNCVAACPTGARDLLSFPSEFIFKAIDILSQYESPNGIKVLTLVCDGCGYEALDYAGKMGLEYSPSILPLEVHCAGRIDTQFILYAFVRGFDGVMICECVEGRCRNLVGNIDLDRRANLFRDVLRSRQINPERLRILGLTPCEGVTCVNVVAEFINELKKLGGESSG